MDTYYCVVLALFFRIYAIAFPLVQSQGLPWTMDKNSHFFDYQTTTSLKDPSSNSDSVIGFGLQCQIEMCPLWTAADSTLLKISLSNPKLSSLSKADSSRSLNSITKYPVFSLWHHGRMTRLFGAKEDSRLSLNLKRGILSLIQSTEQTDSSVTDVRGSCFYDYLNKGEELIKTSKNCTTGSKAQEFKNIHKLFDITTKREFSSAFKFTNEKELIQVSSNENYESFTNLISSVSSQVVVKQDLKIINKKPFGGQINVKTINEALKHLNKKFLVTEESIEADIENVEKSETLSEVVGKLKQEFKHMATVKSASAFGTLVQILRLSTQEEITNLITNEKHKDIRDILVDACSAAQTKESLNAVLQIVELNDPILAERFLLAIAFSTHPSEDLLDILLKFFLSNVQDEKIKESIAGALGAVLYTYSSNSQKVSKKTREILQIFEDRLKNCQDVSCTLIIIRALGNAGQKSSIPVLLNLASSHKSLDVNEAALKALRKMKELNEKDLSILSDIYHQQSRGYDTAVRSKALRYLIKNNISYEDVLKIIQSLNDPYNTELATFTKALLFDKSSNNDNLGKLISKALKNSPRINTYDGLATKGKSLSFHNFLARSETFDSVYDMYVENTRTGVMKRSGMDVDLNGNSIYSFGLFSAGVESLLGEESDDDSVVTAGLALDMLGVAFRPITFFTGRSGLMSAVWSAPSSMTSALQANMLLQDRREFIKLSNGIVVIYDVMGSISMDLSGLISISLWNKNAHTEIMNTGAYSLHSTFQIASPVFSMIEHKLEATGIINFNSDVDFYEKLKSCLQMSRPTVNIKHVSTTREKIRGLKGYTHRRKRELVSPGVSYPLPKKNNDMCREMMKDKN
ncbi:DgyrCDS4294 [Dimorphilus gyrociliatus]|uniref:DgyrCDS4294 n=1 Tax=Dimorphilus gyrociliatus TaxID=2664684 RepID=A0A7I8VL59_9ANNE|nr:DgyrCDS4294 [Dimorphilus gyrociliatus]